jgi:hypothetical protein
MGLYGFGDAQIDAQNRATDQIGVVLTQYNATKTANQLTPGYIASAKMQIQAIVDAYKAAWGNTSRGQAGGVTLQSFIDGPVFSGMDQDMQTLSQISTPAQGFPIASVTPGADLTGGYIPNVGPTNVNISIPGSQSTPMAMGPSNTPGPPSGIVIPGTTVDVSAPDWLKSPLLWMAVGLGVILLMREK